MLTIKDLKNVFADKNVFITGHTGFKGSWLAFLLKEVGANVFGFSLQPETATNNFDLLNLKNNMNQFIGDIRDPEDLNNELKKFQPQFVFHLAAQALVRSSYNDPFSTFSTNIMGSVNILEAVRNCSSVRSLVFITSDKCYKNVEWVWGYRENDELGGHDPYSASKAASEIIHSSYIKSFFDNFTSLGSASTRAYSVLMLHVACTLYCTV